MSMKKSNDTIGNRTHDLPACSAVPQPTAPPRAPAWNVVVQGKRAALLQAVVKRNTLARGMR